MQVEVHHVEAGLARPELAQDRVHVRAVHVGQRAGLVDRLQHVADAALEQPERRGVGQHHRRRTRPECGAQRVQVHTAVRRRIGTVTVRKPAIEAVAGLVPWDESGTMTSVSLLVAAGAVVGTDEQDARSARRAPRPPAAASPRPCR